MSSETLTISAQSLGKKYEIYAQPADRLKQIFLSRLARVTGNGRDSYCTEFWALREVTFDVRRGETVGIIGRNGSGKSTLLQMVCGTLHPTEGEVKSHGRIAALLELGAGFNPEFTGRENVFLSGLLYGIPESELSRRYQSIIDFAGIGDFIHQPVKTYSSGMYVRLAFAIAAHVDADTLIIDEALSVGDVRFSQKCMRYLREFQKHGTLLFVSHDTSAVTNLCSRAIWLDAGRIVMDGTAREVVEYYLAAQHAADRASIGETVTVHSGLGDQPASGAGARQKSDGSDIDGMPTDVIDPRQDKLNGTAKRNLVEIFEFNAEGTGTGNGFGAGAAKIVDVRLLDGQGRACQLVAGGEALELMIEAEVLEPLVAPIFGFYVKDRLGQRLFGDNTYVTYLDEPVKAGAGTRVRARFQFRMPTLANGDYSVDAALASGSQENHTQQHWIHDAINFRASESTTRHGLIGIPMHSIKIESGGGEG